MQRDPQHDANVPERVRAAADVVEPVVLGLAVEERLGEVQDVDDEAEAVHADGGEEVRCEKGGLVGGSVEGRAGRETYRGIWQPPKG